ncbi:unnamed protein product [Mytilus coruscus]|uniref:Uncharacterized protein n=1 Tax=Mytilus coruscus TaxID=42192 RepID=A0A6J8DRZ7_MYTCO|nr:unnamed protein product [Mytilus coruscus]
MGTKIKTKETLDFITELNTQRQVENQVRALKTDKQNEERKVKLAIVIDRLIKPESSIYEEQNVISIENPLITTYNQQSKEENTILSVEAKIQKREKATTLSDKEMIEPSNCYTPNNILSNQHTADGKNSKQHFLDKSGLSDEPPDHNVKMNIEGINGNKLYLKEPLKANSILCL